MTFTVFAIFTHESRNDRWYRCSFCNYSSLTEEEKYNYCPNCGSKLVWPTKKKEERNE